MTLALHCRRVRVCAVVLVLLAGVSASDVCEDTPGEVAQDDETGETLLCSDLVDLCTDDPEIAEICPKTCDKSALAWCPHWPWKGHHRQVWWRVAGGQPTMHVLQK